ncbi:hypothetical protein PG993_008108 [Apiospora rasikravindrae]|uniref:2EXR domain-containing protein n=1 Tax=Apiospora rasikravindrae TaxID=990691 RepID=A0ABR1SZR8_9PEZI
MSITQYTEFHLFPQLPPELRLMIWAYVIEEPHIVHTWGLYDEETNQWVTEIPDEVVDVVPKLRAFPKFPPVHNVCHEARRAFLESPGLVSDTTAAPGAGFGVAWHPERDFLMCHGISERPERRDATPWWSVLDVCQCDWKDPKVWKDQVPGRYGVKNIMFDLIEYDMAYAIGRGDFVYMKWDLMCHFPQADTLALMVEPMSNTKHGVMGLALKCLQGAVNFKTDEFERLWDDCGNVGGFLSNIRDIQGRGILHEGLWCPLLQLPAMTTTPGPIAKSLAATSPLGTI